MKKHIPNTITCCNLISGCIATYFAFGGNYCESLLFIVVGAVFDFFDGMTARLLHVSSPIGKELDSLADVITFGFAPSAMVFSFLDTHLTRMAAQGVGSSALPGALPFLAFVMAAFSALRLAKFNLDERQALGFIGLPTPANALFWGAFIAWAEMRTWFEPYQLPPYIIYVVSVLLPLSCYLLVSEIPMFALKFKTWGWRGNEVKYVFAVSCIPLVLWLGTLGLAAAIGWYVVLSVVHGLFFSAKGSKNV